MRDFVRVSVKDSLKTSVRDSFSAKLCERGPGQGPSVEGLAREPSQGPLANRPLPGALEKVSWARAVVGKGPVQGTWP